MEGQKFYLHETIETINKGDDFQFVFCKFILHRLIKQEFKNFRLTREKKGCGKFDDLVFAYESEDGKCKYHLMQLKCIGDKEYKISYEDLTTNPISYFLLPFYFDHYLEALNYLSKDVDFNDADLEELIICTNVGIEDSLECISKKMLKSRLFQESGSIYKLEIYNLEKQKEIFIDQFLSDRKRLAKELVLNVMLRKTINIQSMIRDQTFSLVKRYYRMLITYVVDIKSKKFMPSFLNGNFKENIQELHDFREDFFDAIIKFYDKYKDKEYVDLKKLVYFGRFKNVTDQKSKICTLILLLKKFNCEEIVKFLENRGIEIIGIPNEDSGICFPSGIIDEKLVDENILKFLQLLTFAVNQTNNENLICTEIVKPEIREGFNVFMKDWYSNGVTFHPDILKSKKNYRRWITKQMLLETLEKLSVNFQGETVIFSDICPSIEVNSSEILMNAFSQNNVLNLGKNLENFYADIYINRTLTQRRKVTMNVFVKNAYFIIVSIDSKSGLTDLQKRYPSDIKLKNLVDFQISHPFYFTTENISLDDLKPLYNRNREYISRAHFHWFTFTGIDLKFEATYPSTSDFCEQFCGGNKPFKELELIKAEKFLIITGDPGIGKTALLENVSNLIKSTNNLHACWIIKISLNDCQDILSDFSYLNDLETIVDFLSRCELCCDVFSRTILKRFLVNDSRLVIIFDGFDEVYGSINRENIVKLLRFLKNKTFVKQIWISTRYHYVKELEKALGTISFEMEDISEVDQISVVTKVWNDFYEASKFPSLSYFTDQAKNLIQRLYSNAESLIRIFNSSINNQERRFLGIPLHTYMLAIAFEEEAKSTTVKLNQMNLMKLYEYFIKKKFKIFFDKKIKDETLREEVIDYYQCCYQNFALEFGGVVSPEEAMILKKKMLPNKNKYINLIRIGLVHMTEKGYQFIHKTFAEYFIAHCLSSNFEINRIEKDALETMTKILLDEGNDFILYLFDTMLFANSNMKPQKSIMLGDKVFVKELDKESLNKLDILGRCNFYYALKYSQFHIISYLIKIDIDLNFESYFSSCLTSFAESCKSYDFTRNSLEENTYIELFEYILEKEDNRGNFASAYLFLCLDLEEEIYFHHWNIVAKLIDKFEVKIPVNSCCIYLISSAPEACFSIFLKWFDKMENFPFDGIVCAAVLGKLLSCEPAVLSGILGRYSSFCKEISVGKLSIDQKNYMYNTSMERMNSLKFSEIINYLRRRVENLKIFRTFLFEQGISPEQFSAELMQKRTEQFRIIYFGFDSHVLKKNICFFFKHKISNFRKITKSKSFKISDFLSWQSSKTEQTYEEDFFTVLREHERICNYNDNTDILEAVLEILKHASRITI